MNRPPNCISPQELARLAVEAFVRDRIVLERPLEPAGVLSQQAGAFVTLRHSDRTLRGCIGTVGATRANVAEEIIHNSISAATRDPRFDSVSVDELSDLRYGVDVLSKPESVSGPEDLDPSTYGVIVETLEGSQRGLLLPAIEGIDSIESQWQAVHAKAGIAPGTPVYVMRFVVTRFGKD